MQIFNLAILAFSATVAVDGLRLYQEGKGHVNDPLDVSTDAFVSWSKNYSKEYESDVEHKMRYNIWKANMHMIDQHNQAGHSYTLKMNEFGDLTHNEFLVRNGYAGASYERTSTTPLFKRTSNKEIGSEVDWRDHGLVSEMKNQGACGSCYSFSATGSIEGQHRKANKGSTISLSEQQIVDCSKKEGNLGCNGGLMDSVFQYIKDEGGDELEKDYPYLGRKGTCKADKKKDVSLKMKGWVDIPSGDEKALTAAIHDIGPVSVAIDASHMSFQFYFGGVYDPYFCSSTALDHGVLAVGYGTEKSGIFGKEKDYYIVKNSWGSSWGKGGYLLMARNHNNKCGIATQASYPVLGN